MSYVVAGVVSGLLLASVFVAIGPIILFIVAKDPPSLYRALLERVSPMALMMSFVVLAYPVWTLIGALFGLVYWTSATAAPGGGLGSPNLVYSLGVLAFAAAAAAPLAVLLRRVAFGVAALAVVFAGVFGWVLPYLVP